MKNVDWRRYAPLGLYLALLAALTSIGLYIVQREMTLALQISLGLILVGLALYALLDPQKVRQLLTGRQARYGSNALILLLAFIGIVVVLNYLVYQNPKRWDMTEDQQFTLATETLDTLGTLSEPVKAQAFFTRRLSNEQAKGLLDQYKFHSNGNFEYEFIDPEQEPVLAEQAKITRDGTIVLVMGDQREPVEIVSEQEMTGALVRLMNPEQRSIYFLTGHGEASLDDTGDASLSGVKRMLESKNYTVQTLNLLAENKIPVDAKVIVVPGPRKPVSSAEVDLLKQYVEAGSALIVMEEPLPLTDFGDQADPLADYLAESWGITLGKDLVIDQTSNQPTFAIGSQWGDHQITTSLRGFVSVMPTARSLTLTAGPTGTSQSEIVSTSANAWAETDLVALGSQNAQVAPDQGVDVLGPVLLSAVGENFNTQARLVVFGDSDFATNGFYTAYANSDLFVNSVDWAAGQEDLISLTPKDTTQRLMVPPQSVTTNLIMLGTVIVLPGLALLGGILVFFQRRRRS